MAQKSSGRTASDAPSAAANFIRRSAASIRIGNERIGQRRAEYLALIEWANRQSRLVSFSYVDQFHPVGSGAEHRVFHDALQNIAIKVTHPNRFGWSASVPGAGASAAEYLRRIFGDQIRLIGVAYEEEQMEVITSQPWISVNPTDPKPSEKEIAAYLESFGFFPTSSNPDAPLFYSPSTGLIVADAHDQNILRDEAGDLAAIDVIIGRPSLDLLKEIMG
jgi:hypothetical protein